MTGTDLPEAEPFSLAVRYLHEDDHRRGAVVAIGGELDVSQVATFRATLVSLLVDGVSPLVVDLADLAFMDSSGLGALVAAHKKARVLKHRLVVACPHGVTLDLLSLTGLIRFLNVTRTVEEAVTESPD